MIGADSFRPQEALMKRTIIALAAAALVAAAMPSPAQARCDGCAIGAGVLGGQAAEDAGTDCTTVAAGLRRRRHRRRHQGGRGERDDRTFHECLLGPKTIGADHAPTAVT